MPLRVMQSPPRRPRIGLSRVGLGQRKKKKKNREEGAVETTHQFSGASAIDRGGESSRGSVVVGPVRPSLAP
jgi:hypothetical protein